MVFLVTQMFPVAILIVPIYIIMANLGLINTQAALVIAYLTVAVPFCAWMLKGYFDTIPLALDEAAAMDGCGPFATFWRVILPLARPGLAVTAFFTFLTAWGEVAYASPSSRPTGSSRSPTACSSSSRSSTRSGSTSPPPPCSSRSRRRSSSSSPSATWSPA